MGFLIVPFKMKSKEAQFVDSINVGPSLLLQIPNRLLRKQEAFFSRATRSHAANFSDVWMMGIKPQSGTWLNYFQPFAWPNEKQCNEISCYSLLPIHSLCDLFWLDYRGIKSMQLAVNFSLFRNLFQHTPCQLGQNEQLKKSVKTFKAC